MEEKVKDDTLFSMEDENDLEDYNVDVDGVFLSDDNEEDDNVVDNEDDNETFTSQNWPQSFR